MSRLNVFWKLSLFRPSWSKSAYPKKLTKKYDFPEKAEKVYKRSKNPARNVKNGNFFQVLGISCFTTLVSPGSENAMFLQKHFYWNMSICAPQIEGILKKAISIEFPLCCKSLFSRIQGSILSLTSQSETFYL